MVGRRLMVKRGVGDDREKGEGDDNAEGDRCVVG